MFPLFSLHFQYTVWCLPRRSPLLITDGFERNIKTLRLKQNGHHFADNILNNEINFLVLYGNCSVWSQISLKFAPKDLINDKPLFEMMMTLFTDAYICVTRPSWVNTQKASKTSLSDDEWIPLTKGQFTMLQHHHDENGTSTWQLTVTLFLFCHYAIRSQHVWISDPITVIPTDCCSPPDPHNVY